MPSSEILRHVALVRIDVSEERIASIISVTRIGELVFHRSVLLLLVTANVIPSSPIVVTLMTEGIHSSETSVLTTAIQHKISEDGILQ
jgi:hypothetical protein